MADMPLTPDALSFPQHRPSAPHYAGLNGTSFPLMARCNSSTLLTNLGMRYCPSSRQIPVGMELGVGLVPSAQIHTGNAGNRPYRSMENLNWTHVSESGLCATNRSEDSECVLRYTTSSHWCGSVGGAQGPENLMFYPQTGLPRKELPLFPHLLFPSGIDDWEVRKGLREKLRLQSARSSAEPPKSLPLRAQLSPAEPEVILHANATAPGSRPPGTLHFTRPEEIKQEVLRRLQLRRQNSSPNLALHSSPSRPTALKVSYTTDNIAESPSDSSPEHRRAPLGRLHIPTFEEFKRMRQKEGSSAAPPWSEAASAQEDARSPLLQSSESYSETGEIRKRETTECCRLGPPNSNTSSSSSPSSPIRTGPSPRLPLQALASSAQEKAPAARGDDFTGGRRRSSSLDPAGSVPFPPSKENWDRPSSCCPALLLEGTDLSSYGAKIYKMKDGLIGSALDLIKKRWVREECVKVKRQSCHSDALFVGLFCLLWTPNLSGSICVPVDSP